MLQNPVQLLILTLLLSVYSMVHADGVSIDKVYTPYVQLLEQEFEYRLLAQKDSNQKVDGQLRHKLGYGQSLSDQFFIEAYLIGNDKKANGFLIKAYELELKWQLTEQGEYDVDWGLLFELEKNRSENNWEAVSTLIALHEWRDWILTGNLSLIYEWGSSIDNELEAALSAQLRYRNTAQFEPAIELYQSQDTQGVGSVLTGLYRLSGGKKLLWEFGAIFGLNAKTAATNWKLNIEYEF